MMVEQLPAPTFGEWLQDQLNERGWSRPRLARYIEYSPGAVASWVRGDRVPEERACILIAKAFGVDANEVLRRAARPLLHEVPTDLNGSLTPDEDNPLLEYALENAHKVALEDQRRAIKMLRALEREDDER